MDGAQLRTVHTGALDGATLTAARKLLDDAFEGDFSDEDWDHTVGGLHVLVLEGDAELVGHAALVQRRLLYGEHALRTGYVEGVAVREDRRGLGYGAAMMREVERVVRGAYELGALSASEDAVDFYAARGWRPWQGPTSVLTPAGARRTPEDDGGVFVLAVTGALDLSRSLTADPRPGDAW
ncbi:GNAT family N-acetyltransferase [Streptomyces daliensis]|uniref:GNAT family N-acetyltransferase n=1 Tax=Streptomyces daliensis TaxID=299421 RepID=A0A8T4ITA2_9ACTN|nr:GNAT family N-acetyltransferase [Streptomyces daliensis]